jgi:hypothetical protein
MAAGGELLRSQLKTWRNSGKEQGVELSNDRVCPESKAECEKGA